MTKAALWDIFTVLVLIVQYWGENMISLNFRDPRPIYEQVKDSLRRLIVSGALPPDEKLPSVRELASELAINPNTIQRAYRELETEGYICSVPGKGSFACERAGVDEQRKAALFKSFDESVTELRFLGVTDRALMERITARGGERK